MMKYINWYLILHTQRVHINVAWTIIWLKFAKHDTCMFVYSNQRKMVWSNAKNSNVYQTAAVQSNSLQILATVSQISQWHDSFFKFCLLINFSLGGFFHLSYCWTLLQHIPASSILGYFTCTFGTRGILIPTSSL